MTTHDIQLELEGLIQLLARNLYADTDVFLREMLQNAKDSTVKRKEVAKERGEDEVPKARVDVEIRRGEKALVIRDNGAGLTRDEVHEYLSTIGRSGTRALRDQLEQAGRGQAIELIGQFGIGLLSAFLVADKVELVTRAAGSQALRWRSSGGKSYELEEAERPAVGTTLTLRLRDEHTRYLDGDRLARIIYRYADFIGVPIHLDGSAEPVNTVRAPWRVDYGSEAARRDAHRTFWKRRFDGESDLSVLVLDEPIQWREDGDEHQGRLEGVVGLTNQPASAADFGDTIDLYVRNMFITSRPRGVVPKWANFVRGVVQCDQLRPNAARDGVMNDAVMHAVKEALGEAILGHLRKMADEERGELVGILRLHSSSILPVATRADQGEFFRAVADLMPLRTDSRPMTMAEYRDGAEAGPSGRDVIYYVRDYTAMNQYRLLVAARGVRVFDASEPYAESFLQRYAHTYPERVELRRLDADEKVDFLSALPSDDTMRFRALKTAGDEVLAAQACRVEIARFEPHELPALVVEPKGRRRRREMEGVVEEVGVPSFLEAAVGDMLAQEVEPSVLYLNAANDTVDALARRAPGGGDVLDAAIRALYANASLLSGRRLTESETRQLFAYNTRLLDLVLDDSSDGKPQ
jgi:molecular chaperone HtpG